MPESRPIKPAAKIPAALPPGLSLQEILLVVFKHKWKVLLFTVIGLAAAVAFYMLDAPLYQSDAKLLVRYVVERSTVDTVASAGDVSNKPSDNVLNSEVEILKSWDLYEQVADQVGVNRLCPGVKAPTTLQGAQVIASGLSVGVMPYTSVILVSYRNTDPQLAPLVLEDLLEAYSAKHLEIHRPKAAFEAVSQQADIIGAQLAKTEEDLKKKKADAGIISVDDTATNLNLELEDTENQIAGANIALAEEEVLVAEMEKHAGSTGEGDAQQEGTPAGKEAVKGASGWATRGGSHASADEVAEYQQCVDEIKALRKKRFALLSIYNPQSYPVRLNESELAELERQRQDEEKRHPDLLEQAPADENAPPQPQSGTDLVSERARLASLKAGIQSLQAHLKDVQQQAAKFAQVSPEIEELERTRALELTNYTTSQSKLQNATVDYALDPSNIPNISTFQKPSAAMKVVGTRQKVILGLAAGGLGVGLAVAFLIEIVLDQTVKRPRELDHRMGIPLLLSIPYISGRRIKRANGANGKEVPEELKKAIVKNGHSPVAPWDPGHFIRPYAEAIRDRLGYYIDSTNMTHRPKLIAVAGSASGSGTSTLASGIASAMSETEAGKVLLVDMSTEHTAVHRFFNGNPTCSLATALSKEDHATSATEHLYLATTATNGNGGGYFGLKRFREMLPDLQASDFDYIVFDMPPLSETSPTVPMAAYMDMVIYVVEAEKGQREVVKRDYAQLCARKPDVSVILNKIRSYAPKWIEGGI